VGMMRSVIPTSSKVIIRIEPVIGVALQDTVVILLINPERAALSEAHFEFEGMVINSKGGNLCYELA